MKKVAKSGLVKWQRDCFETIKDDENVIISSPTGSGKTKVFLKWALEKRERPIYITAPIKALSNQRFRELEKLGFTVGIETGDVKYVPENCDIICCTQEIYTKKYVDDSDATLIIDEFHYIFENPERSRAYIDALNKSKAKNILLCSATLGDIEELAKYLKDVSGRDFEYYKNNKRLTRLKYGGKILPEEIDNSFVVTFSMFNIESILDDLYFSRIGLLDEYEINRIMELTKKYNIKQDSDVVKLSKKGLAGYHGQLLPKEKLFIEECYEEGLIDTVVGTDALALGVNFPVQNVVFTQLAKYHEGPISKSLFDQLCGRAGRKGYYDIGNIYYCDEFFDENGKKLENKDYKTSELFLRLIKAKDDNFSITLNPKLKDILMHETTIEEEAEYVKRFSTTSVDLNQVISDIRSKILYITNFSIKKHMPEILEDEDDIDREFSQNIGEAYFDEFPVEKNCSLFADILLGKNSSFLREKYADTFFDLLELRKYLMALPSRYKINIDFAELESLINSIDHTVLNIHRGRVSKGDIGTLIEDEGISKGEIEELLSDMGEKIKEKKSKRSKVKSFKINKRNPKEIIEEF